MNHQQPPRTGAANCSACMDIRKERHWCPTCTAPTVMEENIEAVEIFIEALPAWRTTGLDRITEGFERSEILSIMEMRETQDRPAVWRAIHDMEGELSRIRSQLKKNAPPPKPGQMPKPLRKQLSHG